MVATLPLLAALNLLHAGLTLASESTSRPLFGAQAECPANPPAPLAKKGSPNIILVLCDDMDLALGGFTPLKKTAKLLSSKGATAKNYFIRAPRSVGGPPAVPLHTLTSSSLPAPHGPHPVTHRMYTSYRHAHLLPLAVGAPHGQVPALDQDR